MERLQNEKRKRADEPLRANVGPPIKKTKTKRGGHLQSRKSWEHPPEFYDRLSKIFLTRGALKEIDRRNRPRRSKEIEALNRARRSYPSTGTPSSTIPTRDLAQFARRGGPDLRDLRGYPHPPTDPQPVAMSSSRSSRGRRNMSINPASTDPTSSTPKTKKSGPYDRNFDVILTEEGVHATYRSRKPDLEEVRAALVLPRRSLSPSRFSEGAFEAFQEKNDMAKDEDDVLATVIPTIIGQDKHFFARNTPFSNLEPLIDDSIVPPQPDIYSGAHPEELARSARDELSRHIIPSTMDSKPMVPNVFLEAKGPDGSGAVAMQQIRHVGAIGSRGIHSLQNYRVAEPQYDGKAYTFGFIYHQGTLKSYAHHMTTPTTEGGRPEYHMTQLRSFAMTDTRSAFVEGAAAFRNTLDLAEKYRANFIRDANARAAQPIAETTKIQSIDDPADEPAHSPSHGAAQIQHREESPDELPLSSARWECDDLQDGSGIDPPPSVTTSFTSSFDPYQGRPKRQRSPRSQAAEGHASKARSRGTREAGSSSASGSATAGAGGPLRVWTFLRKEKVCFFNAQEQEVETEANDWVEVTDDGDKHFYWKDPKSGRVFWTSALATAHGEESGSN